MLGSTMSNNVSDKPHILDDPALQSSILGSRALQRGELKEELPLVVPGAMTDDFSRNVYCLLGIPIDLITMQSILRLSEAAAAAKAPFLLSTPNLNILVASQRDQEFRETLLSSDLCPVDGIPLVWMARLIGIPIEGRIAGSDIFATLKAEYNSAKPLKLFLFGGAEGLAAVACREINAQRCGLHCVGSLYPGFGSVADMSRDAMINVINKSGADFLLVCVGTHKGQIWLRRNHDRLIIPIRAYMGAVVNFESGTVMRAPPIMRRLNLEWLWRIKEEPPLWTRYWSDGCALLRLLFSRVLPLAIYTKWLRFRYDRPESRLSITRTGSDDCVTLSFCGPLTTRQTEQIIPAFRDAMATKRNIILDLSNSLVADARFLGLLLMMRKNLRANNCTLTVTGLSFGLRKIFQLNHLDTL